MDDERLLAEALRAHAAGGVSTPLGAVGAAPASANPAVDPDPGAPRWPNRFRPAEGPAASPVPRRPGAGPTGPTGPAVAPMSTPRPPTPPRAWTGPATPSGGRPVPAPPGSGPPRPGAPLPGGHPPPAGPPGPPAPAPGRHGAWTASRLAWWSGVALLGGAVAGALGAVVTLLVP